MFRNSFGTPKLPCANVLPALSSVPISECVAKLASHLEPSHFCLPSHASTWKLRGISRSRRRKKLLLLFGLGGCAIGCTKGIQLWLKYAATPTHLSLTPEEPTNLEENWPFQASKCPKNQLHAGSRTVQGSRMQDIFRQVAEVGILAGPGQGQSQSRFSQGMARIRASKRW